MNLIYDKKTKFYSIWIGDRKLMRYGYIKGEVDQSALNVILEQFVKNGLNGPIIRKDEEVYL